MPSPLGKIYRIALFARLLPFLKTGVHHLNRTLKSEPDAEACFYMNDGNNHTQDYCKILLSSGRTSYSCDVTWENPTKPFVRLLPAAAEESTSPPLSPPPMPAPSSVTPESQKGPGVWYELLASTVTPSPPCLLYTSPSPRDS